MYMQGFFLIKNIVQKTLENIGYQSSSLYHVLSGEPLFTDPVCSTPIYQPPTQPPFARHFR